MLCFPPPLPLLRLLMLPTPPRLASLQPLLTPRNRAVWRTTLTSTLRLSADNHCHQINPNRHRYWVSMCRHCLQPLQTSGRAGVSPSSDPRGSHWPLPPPLSFLRGLSAPPQVCQGVNSHRFWSNQKETTLASLYRSILYANAQLAYLMVRKILLVRAYSRCFLLIYFNV